VGADVVVNGVEPGRCVFWGKKVLAGAAEADVKVLTNGLTHWFF
jgi:hypothetical protein